MINTSEIGEGVIEVYLCYNADDNIKLVEDTAHNFVEFGRQVFAKDINQPMRA